MGLLNMIIATFVILILVMTFVNYPSLSIKFLKAAGESAGKVLGVAKDMVGSWIKDWNSKAGDNDSKKTSGQS